MATTIEVAPMRSGKTRCIAAPIRIPIPHEMRGVPSAVDLGGLDGCDCNVADHNDDGDCRIVQYKLFLLIKYRFM